MRLAAFHTGSMRLRLDLARKLSDEMRLSGTAAGPRSSKTDCVALRACVSAAVAILTLASCAEYAAVKPKRAVLQGPAGPEPLASAEKEIERGLRQVESKPLHALGDCVEALQVASRELQRNPGN